MKNLVIVLLLLSSSIGFDIDTYAQRHPRYRHGRIHPIRNRKVVIVRQSPFRPAGRIVIFRPVWRPAYAYHRRWVFFPGYNLYWDNWRNHYVFWDGTVWVSQATPPPVEVPVNLAETPNHELRPDDDDNDSVYVSNQTHVETYKGK